MSTICVSEDTKKNLELLMENKLKEEIKKNPKTAIQKMLKRQITYDEVIKELISKKS